MSDNPNLNQPETVQGIQELHKVIDEYATIGDNPFAEQTSRWKKCVKQIELAQEELSRMGSVYESGGHTQLSEYCQALYIALDGVLIGIRSLRQHM